MRVAIAGLHIDTDTLMCNATLEEFAFTLPEFTKSQPQIILEKRPQNIPRNGHMHLLAGLLCVHDRDHMGAE